MKRKHKPGSENGKPLLSVAIIAKDAEAPISEAIRSVKNVADEVVVVVDDRTQDNTLLVAEGMGAIVHPYTWKHNFSAARNEAQNRCLGQWVMWMDADEILFHKSAPYVRPMLESTKCDVIECLAMVDKSYQLPEYELDQFGQGAEIYKCRIWKRRPGVKWIRRVHEAPHFEEKYGLENLLKDPDIKIYHKGTFSDDKKLYYRALSILDMFDRPEDPEPFLKMASVYIRDYRPHTAIGFLDQIDMAHFSGHSERSVQRYHMLYGQACHGMAALEPSLSREEQLDLFSKALAHYADCQSSLARMQAALIHVLLDREEDARRILKESHEADPSHVVLSGLWEVAQRTESMFHLKQACEVYFTHLGQTNDPIQSTRLTLQVIEPIEEPKIKRLDGSDPKEPIIHRPNRDDLGGLGINLKPGIRRN
jgi:glycosyltransferase involved in cell wall biosynthesis